MKKYYCAVCKSDVKEGGCIHKAPWKYQSGDATNTQKLKEAGLTLEQYQKACLSVEEFIKLYKREFNLIAWTIYEVDKNFEPDIDKAIKIAQEKTGFRNAHRVNEFDEWAVFDKNSPFQAKEGLHNAFIEAIRKYKIRDDFYWIFIVYN